MFIVLASLFIVAGYRLFDIGGIAPNILLVALVLFVLNSRRFTFVLAEILFLIVFAVFFTPQWTSFVVAAGVIALAVFFLKDSLTGTRFLDFLGAVLTGTFVFYLVIGIARLSSLPFADITLEALYNLILGSVLWVALDGKIVIRS
ncbi:MAG TPA: hypothetical protein VNK70_02805 [Candidatus Paceibacterota bacterium]|nr:hypothetical protein [Candidatus Paceibacterota bacterium]